MKAKIMKVALHMVPAARLTRILIATAVTAALLPAAVNAQQVRGRIVDASSGGGVTAGFVSLNDAWGKTVAQMLTDTLGRYALTAPLAGTYTLTVERIGYPRFVSAPFTIGAAPVIRNLTLTAAPIELPAITTEPAASRCVVHTGVDPADVALWNEVEKALTITSWTQRNVPITYEWEERRIGLSSDRFRSNGHNNVTYGSGTLAGSPFAALPQDSLLTRGFIQRRSGQWVFYGPDAELIMSDAFQSTHCFHMTHGASNDDLIGLAFESAGQVKPYDIEGTLWLDRSTRALRYIEYSYDRLPFAGDTKRAGGRVDFAQLRSGQWIVSGWTIRGPVPSAAAGAPVVNEHSQRILKATIGGRVVYEAAAHR
jgi:hypothetical protein